MFFRHLEIHGMRIFPAGVRSFRCVQWIQTVTALVFIVIGINIVIDGTHVLDILHFFRGRERLVPLTGEGNDIIIFGRSIGMIMILLLVIIIIFLVVDVEQVQWSQTQEKYSDNHVSLDSILNMFVEGDFPGWANV